MLPMFLKIFASVMKTKELSLVLKSHKTQNTFKFLPCKNPLNGSHANKYKDLASNIIQFFDHRLL